MELNKVENQKSKTLNPQVTADRVNSRHGTADLNIEREDINKRAEFTQSKRFIFHTQVEEVQLEDKRSQYIILT